MNSCTKELEPESPSESILPRVILLNRILGPLLSFIARPPHSFFRSCSRNLIPSKGHAVQKSGKQPNPYYFATRTRTLSESLRARLIRVDPPASDCNPLFNELSSYYFTGLPSSNWLATDPLLKTMNRYVHSGAYEDNVHDHLQEGERSKNTSEPHAM